MDAARTRGPCLTPHCPGERQTRGLCAACYECFRRERDAGVFTDEEAVERGLIKPRYTCRRKNQAWFRCQREIVFPSE